MPSLTLRPSHKAVLAYYESLAAFGTLGATHELAVKNKDTCIDCHKGIAHHKPKGMKEED